MTNPNPRARVRHRYQNTDFLSALPDPQTYYAAEFPKLFVTGRDWISVLCCFHADKNPSLRLNLKNGAFRCFACNAHGGNIIAFHCQRYQLSFREALSTLRGIHHG